MTWLPHQPGTSLGTDWMRSIIAQRSSIFLSRRLFLQGLLEGCEIFWPIVVKRTDALMNRKLSVTPAGRRNLTIPIADPARACLGVL